MTLVGQSPGLDDLAMEGDLSSCQEGWAIRSERLQARCSGSSVDGTDPRGEDQQQLGRRRVREGKGEYIGRWGRAAAAAVAAVTREEGG